MPMSRRWGIMLGLLCYLAAMLIWGSNGTQAQDATLDDEIAFEQAAQAVVRILACYADACEIGSGVLIDPNGIILTAWHVVARDPTNLDSDLYENLEIQMTSHIAVPPETRYWARVIAIKPDQDLALLRITYDVQAGKTLSLPGNLKLPWLPLSATTPHTARLRIMGYPPAEGDTISYRQREQSGIEEDGSVIRVDGELSIGYSGGPALMRREGEPYEIVGLVIKRRQGEVTLIRNIRQLQGLRWLRGAQQAWAENIEIQVGPDRTEGVEIVQIGLDLHALDLAASQVQAWVLLYDSMTSQPWTPDTTDLPRNEHGQVYLMRRVTITSGAEIQRGITLRAPVSELDRDPLTLQFRMLIWDERRGLNLWLSPQLHAPKAVASIQSVASDLEVTAAGGANTTLPLTPTPTPDSPAPADDEQRAADATVAAQPTGTATATPTPDLDATGTAIANVLATYLAATQTAMPTATATATPTPNLAATQTHVASQVETAIAATLTRLAIIAATATPTATPRPVATGTPTSTLVVESRCIVISPSLNLRSGPGTNYQPPIGSLARGAELIPRARNSANTWLEVEVLSTGRIGWVSSGVRYVNCNIDINTLPMGVIPPTPTPDRLPSTNTPIPVPVVTLTLPPPAPATAPATAPSTYTPTPLTSPATISFYAERTSLSRGECTILRWDVENVQEIYIDVHETTGHVALEVCPTATQTFRLRILHRNGAWEERTVTIEIR